MVEYESFEDVLGDLDLNEEELKRLVSEGSLRAFRDDDRMKFRKDDIENLRRRNLTDLGSQPTVAGDDVGLDDGLEVVEETDETVLDVGDLSEDVDFEDTGSTSVPTVELDGGLDGDDVTLTEELTFDSGDEFADAEATVAMDDGVTLDEDDLGLETEPLDGLDDGEATVVDAGGLDFDDDMTVDTDEGLDFDEGGDEFGAGDDFGSEYAPPAALQPQVQVQERIKYVEILPSETWWTKLLGVFVIGLLGYSLFAVFGIEDRDESLAGTAGVGFALTGKHQNIQLEGVGMRPEVPEGKTWAQVRSETLRNPGIWPASGHAQGGDGKTFYAGQQVIRRYAGTASPDPLGAPANQSILTHADQEDMSPEWLQAKLKTPGEVDQNLLRRSATRPARTNE